MVTYARGRELTNKAVELAERTGDREVAAEYLGESALREAELGETASARRYAQAGPSRSFSPVGRK